jgi:hypothetical protein
MTTPDVRIRLDILSREEVICEKPLLTVDRQMGLNIVHPDGKVPSSLIVPDQIAYYIFGRRQKQFLI